MAKKPFRDDIRHKDPHRTAYRRARFKDGWKNGANRDADAYTKQTLEQLTWQNVGYRMGEIFGETPEQQMDELYDWCVRQLKTQSKKKE